MKEVKKFYDTHGYYFPIDAVENIKADEAAHKLINLSENLPKNIKHLWNLQAHLLSNWIMDKIPKGDFDLEAIAAHDLASAPNAPSNYATS